MEGGVFEAIRVATPPSSTNRRLLRVDRVDEPFGNSIDFVRGEDQRVSLTGNFRIARGHRSELD